MAVDAAAVRELFTHWRDVGAELFVVLFDRAGKLHSLTGRVSNLSEDDAVIAAASSNARLRIAGASHVEIEHHSDQVRAISLTFDDGESAFVVSRTASPDLG